ncbi:MAG: hypothetical protein CVU71_05035 [Deltaproteobacteria bacterium HGW-Deltaproteobacteria-6]|jgi:hypothetical protein|nr:MAG: hypothetical protein CVU71_05035 [Deltaproteobacteria bacterium HGW-Deltaproteobacteria-6]
MQTVWESKGRKIHTRKIEVSTYEYDGQRIIVEGLLKDDRYQETHAVTGETFPRGVIHHMGIRLLINCSSLMIEDIDVDLIAVPREACRETIECLAPIRGLTITRGFTSKVKKIAGGNKGCTHLLELLLAMAPAAVQGFAAHQSQKPPASRSDHAGFMLKYLINTCHAWREDGPYVKLYNKMINTK